MQQKNTAHTKNRQNPKTTAREKCCKFTPQEEEEEEESWLSFREESKKIPLPSCLFKHLAIICHNIIEDNNIIKLYGFVNTDRG